MPHRPGHVRVGDGANFSGWFHHRTNSDILPSSVALRLMRLPQRRFMDYFPPTVIGRRQRRPAPTALDFEGPDARRGFSPSSGRQMRRAYKVTSIRQWLTA